MLKLFQFIYFVSYVLLTSLRPFVVILIISLHFYFKILEVFIFYYKILEAYLVCPLPVLEWVITSKNWDLFSGVTVKCDNLSWQSEESYVTIVTFVKTPISKCVAVQVYASLMWAYGLSPTLIQAHVDHFSSLSALSVICHSKSENPAHISLHRFTELLSSRINV